MGIIKPLPSAGSSPRLLRPSDLNTLGTITAAAAANNRVTMTIPASVAAMSTAQSAPGLVWWDLGFTIQDVVDRYVGIRISEVSIAGGTSADAVLAAGIVYTNSVPNLNTDEFGWLQLNFGLSAAANTTCNTVTRRDTNSIITGTAVADYDFADYVLRHQSVGDSRESFVGWTVGAAARAYSVTVDATAITRSLRCRAFVAGGRSAVEASPIAVTFKAELLPAGSA